MKENLTISNESKKYLCILKNIYFFYLEYIYKVIQEFYNLQKQIYMSSIYMKQWNNSEFVVF